MPSPVKKVNSTRGGWPRVLFLAGLLCSYITSNAQTVDGTSGIMLNADADVLARGHYATGVLTRALELDSNTHWGTPLILMGGFGGGIELGVTLPLTEGRNDSPRLIGDYVGVGGTWRLLGEDVGPFRLALLGQYQQELFYNRPSADGGSLFNIGAAVSIRLRGSWQFHFNGLHATSDSDITGDHWVFGAAVSGHMMPKLEAFFDSRWCSEDFIGQGASLQALLGVRWTLVDRLLISTGCGVAGDKRGLGPMGLVGITLFAETLKHNDYQRFVSRLHPPPLEKIEELRSDRPLSRVRVGPAKGREETLPTSLLFKPGEVSIDSTTRTSLVELEDELLGADSSYALRILGSGDAGESGIKNSLLGLTRTISALIELQKAVPEIHTGQFLLGVLSEQPTKIDSGGAVQVRSWKAFERSYKAAIRRQRALLIHSESDSVVRVLSTNEHRQLNALMRTFVPVDSSEALVITVQVEETDSLVSALRKGLQAWVELVQNRGLKPERVLLRISSDPHDPVPTRPLDIPSVEAVLNSWQIAGDSLFALIDYRDNAELNSGVRGVVGLLNTKRGWITTYGDLLSTRKLPDLKRAKPTLLEKEGTLKLAWRLPGGVPDPPRVRLIFTGAASRVVLDDVLSVRFLEVQSGELFEKACGAIPPVVFNGTLELRVVGELLP